MNPHVRPARARRPLTRRRREKIENLIETLIARLDEDDGDPDLEDDTEDMGFAEDDADDVWRRRHPWVLYDCGEGG